MKSLYQTTFALLLLLWIFPFQEDFLYCDYHNMKAFYDREEYPNGKCYKVYTHPIWKDGKRYVHKLSTPCL